MTGKIKNVAILCSGGDSPGMNCAIRSIARTAIGNNLKVHSIYRGFSGMLEEKFKEMDPSSVGNILQLGGTIIGSSRCPEFHEKETREKAFKILKKKNIDALFIIGGNGSFKGAMEFQNENFIPIIGIPGTIDNDVAGTEYTIGFDTAVHNAVDAVDKIRDTANSHERTFIIEVMGRNSPEIAVHVGICIGAENIIFDPENCDLNQIAKDNERGKKRGKKSSIIIVAEGETPGLSYKIQQRLKEDHQISAPVCILGHIQRGGRPTAFDRFIASKMGHQGVLSLLEGNHSHVTAHVNGKISMVPLKDCIAPRNQDPNHYMKIIKNLSI